MKRKEKEKVKDKEELKMKMKMNNRNQELQERCNVTHHSTHACDRYGADG